MVSNEGLPEEKRKPLSGSRCRNLEHSLAYFAIMDKLNPASDARADLTFAMCPCATKQTVNKSPPRPIVVIA